MFRHPLTLISVLAAAIGVPYVAFDEQVKAIVRAQLARWTNDSPAGQGDPLAKVEGLLEPAAHDKSASPGSSAVAKAAASPATAPLEESIRFDVTPEWVTGRWPKATSVIGDSEHLGLRVMLVSGTSPTDVAGALTYYFNREQRVERITLDGVTGDPSRVVNHAVSTFGLRPAQTKEPGLYYTGDRSAPGNMLKVVALPVERPDAPLARVQVMLDLARAGAGKIKVAGEQPDIVLPSVLPSSYRRW